MGRVLADGLQSAYKVSVLGTDLEILMRHRALLFGLLGGFIIYLAFKHIFQGAALVMAAISMMGFILLSYLVGDYNAEISKVVFIDWLVCILLLVVVILKYECQK